MTGPRKKGGKQFVPVMKLGGKAPKSATATKAKVTKKNNGDSTGIGEDEMALSTEDCSPELSFDEMDYFGRELENYRQDFERTMNPVYVWRAINCCSRRALESFNEAQKELSSEKYIEVVESEMIAGRWPPAPTTLPDWCMRYLVDCAIRVDYLNRGLDERKAPKNIIPDEYMKAVRHWRGNSTLFPEDATTRLAWAFCFVRPGWNAFSEMRRERKKEDIAEYFLFLRDEHNLSGREAREALLQQLGREDDRQLRRILGTVSKPASDRGSDK